MTYEFTTSGVCARKILIEMDGETIKNVQYVGGCSGNTQGVAALAKGMNAKDYIERCKGIKCGFKSTSCPDQLAIALQEILARA